MSNVMYPIGNIGNIEDLKFVPIGNESKAVLNFSVFVDDYKRNSDGTLEQTAKGFWLRCSLWGREAENAAHVLTKGVRVLLIGSLVQGKDWIDDKNERRPGKLELEAERVFIAPSRIESITWRPSRTQDAPTESFDDEPQY